MFELHKQFVNTADSYAVKLIWVLNYLLQQQTKILREWPRLQNQFGPDQILSGPRSGPNLVM